MLKEGDKAPDFKLTADDDSVVSLKDFKGKTVVLYFYPKDNTSGCTKEASGFKDALDAFEEKDTVILGVSKDSVKSHKKFKEKLELPFLLLSDEELNVCNAYDVWKEKTVCGRTSMGIERSTFVIDPKGKIKKIFPKVKVTGHVEDVLKEIE